MKCRLFCLISLFPLVLLSSAALQAQSGLSSDPGESSPLAVQPAKASSPRWPDSEQWNALPLSKSGLNTSVYTAAVLSKSDEPEYTQELVRVQWRGNDPIDLYVVLPHGVTKPPAILYLYDYRFGTERFRDDGWRSRATKGGFAAVGFTSALSIERRRSPRPLKEWFVSNLDEALGASVHDVQMILNYLASRGDIDMSRIGMYGQGSGGAIALLAAAVDSRISVLDILNPWGDWPDWLKDSPQIPEDERPDYLKPEFLKKVAGLDPVDYIPQLRLKALRIQQIKDDPVTPLSAKEKIAAAAPAQKVIVWYQDADAHVAVWRTEGLSGWIRKQYSPGAE